jgi:hypothetical protein
MARLMRRLTIGGVASALAASAAGFAVNVFSVQNQVCALPVGQPALSDLCGALGLGDRPNREERIAFEALPPGDCDALSAYREAFEESPLRALVDSRLADRRPAPEPKWTPTTNRQALYQPQTERSETTLDAARAAALAAAEGQALRLCRTAEASGFYRVTGVRPVAEQWECEQTGGSFACSFMGLAECAVDQRETVYVCGAGHSDNVP